MFERNNYLIFTPSVAKFDTSEPKMNGASGNDQLEMCHLQLAQEKEKFIRVSADFANYKRRMQREQSHWLDVGATRVLTQLLSIADDFDRALAQQKSKPVSADVSSWLTGFELIHKSLQKLLESFDVKEISSDLPFDPELHEAIVSVEASGRASGDIIEILQKGYIHKGKVLRPAQVSVAK